MVDECCCLLGETYDVSEPVAHAALLAMKMIDAALQKEEEFLATLRQSPAHSVMVTPISELLLSINPRSRKTDYLVSVARYVTLAVCVVIVSCLVVTLSALLFCSRYVSYSSYSSELALVAVSILHSVSGTVRVSREMLSAITADHVSSC